MKKQKDLLEETMFDLFATMVKGMIEAGVTPEIYTKLYNLVQEESKKEESKKAEKKTPAAKLRSMTPKKIMEGIPGAADKSITLKLTMQYVNKPPMWREFRIPADYNFLDLHEVIQYVCGFYNCHLWNFGKRAYDQELTIGMPDNENAGFGSDDYCTHKADETPVTAFLKKKGDKLVYTYDYGDSWQFNISVVEVKDEKCECAKLLNWKSILQPTEDCGGPWCYCQMRDFLTNEKTMKPKEKREKAQALCYENAQDLMDELEDQLIDPDYVDECLEGYAQEREK